MSDEERNLGGSDRDPQQTGPSLVVEDEDDGKVISFPGDGWISTPIMRDENGTLVHPDEVLKSLMGKLKQVVVVGIFEEGEELSLNSSFRHHSDAHYLMRQAEMAFLNADTRPWG
jgi:hypothetical protein